jgi:hypothetical protein
MKLTDSDGTDVPEGGAPALVLGTVGSGHVLWVNNDLSYSNRRIHPKVLRIYLNAAKWARSR